jgi:hypothetical protein
LVDSAVMGQQDLVPVHQARHAVDLADGDQAFLVQRLDVVVGQLQADDADDAAGDELQGEKADDEDQAGLDGEVGEHAGTGMGGDAAVIG